MSRHHLISLALAGVLNPPERKPAEPIPARFMTRPELEAEVERLRGGIEMPATWAPIDTAPRDATWIALLTKDERGRRWRYVAHFAEGGGEDQPPFGPGWFYTVGDGYSEVVGTPTHWAPLPREPKSGNEIVNEVKP